MSVMSGRILAQLLHPAKPEYISVSSANSEHNLLIKQLSVT